MSDAYYHASGSLKLKGGEDGVKKKKKKSKKDKEKLASAVSKTDSGAGSGAGSGSEKSPATYQYRQKTAAELKFEETQRKRQEAKVEKVATKSHKERVAEFNSYLENLSEHYDIPKVGPG
ncbi:hypothetical protein HK097_008481 [Rhizophlyctis rosea]|uniref:DUF1754-domain-containing protein n=1 Tax=Rhizophlyctis rosea TaxID=64517 RepID=A0AAD5X9A0_9FUNG|nr:hypothetical protein HK097_008481 [Rhizophlyctis rosea]